MVTLAATKGFSDCPGKWELLNQLSSNPENTVIGIVRNKVQTEKRIDQELGGRPNITILEADLTKYNDLEVSSPARDKESGNWLPGAKGTE
jgi:hypothetical protein